MTHHIDKNLYFFLHMESMYTKIATNDLQVAQVLTKNIRSSLTF